MQNITKSLDTQFTILYLVDTRNKSISVVFDTVRAKTLHTRFSKVYLNSIRYEIKCI
jgi:hypothetical protein